MIAVTGATGHLGKLVVQQLLQRRPSRDIVAVTRNVEKAKDIAALGVTVRYGDYSKPDSLGPALAGIEKLLFISSSEVGRRVPQHTAVVQAAKQSEVRLLAYTSILRADTTAMKLAAEHKATEEVIRASGLQYVLLRNGWYLENYTEHLDPALQHGAMVGCADGGRIAAAARADYAAAAVAVLTGAGHENRTYELAGDQRFTMSELAAEVSRRVGRTIAYQDVPPERYSAILAAAGLPAVVADMYADADLGVARGDLDDTSGQLHRLIGRPTTSLADAVTAALPR